MGGKNIKLVFENSALLVTRYFRLSVCTWTLNLLHKLTDQLLQLTCVQQLLHMHRSPSAEPLHIACNFTVDGSSLIRDLLDEVFNDPPLLHFDEELGSAFSRFEVGVGEALAHERLDTLVDHV